MHRAATAFAPSIANEIGHGFIKDIIGGTDEARALAHGVSGGLFSAADGGSFGSGFAASFVGGYTENTNNLILTVLSSGTAAAVSGGKFGNGAMRGAFIYMYNNMEGFKSEISSEKTGEQRYRASGLAISVFDSGPLSAVGGAISAARNNIWGEVASNVLGVLGVEVVQQDYVLEYQEWQVLWGYDTVALLSNRTVLSNRWVYGGRYRAVELRYGPSDFHKSSKLLDWEKLD